MEGSCCLFYQSPSSSLNCTTSTLTICVSIEKCFIFSFLFKSTSCNSIFGRFKKTLCAEEFHFINSRGKLPSREKNIHRIFVFSVDQGLTSYTYSCMHVQKLVMFRPCVFLLFLICSQISINIVGDFLPYISA